MRTSQLVYLMVGVWACRRLGCFQLWSGSWESQRLFEVVDDVAQEKHHPLTREK